MLLAPQCQHPLLGLAERKIRAVLSQHRPRPAPPGTDAKSDPALTWEYQRRREERVAGRRHATRIRTTRWEFTDNHALIASCLIRHFDIDSGRIGYRVRGKWVNLPNVAIERETGLSPSAVSLHLGELRHEGFLMGPGREGPGIIPQTWQGIRGKAKWRCALRVLTVKFWDWLHLLPRLYAAREWKNKQRGGAPPAPPGTGGASALVSALARGMDAHDRLGLERPPPDG